MAELAEKTNVSAKERAEKALAAAPAPEAVAQELRAQARENDELRREIKTQKERTLGAHLGRRGENNVWGRAFTEPHLDQDVGSESPGMRVRRTGGRSRGDTTDPV